MQRPCGPWASRSHWTGDIQQQHVFLLRVVFFNDFQRGGADGKGRFEKVDVVHITRGNVFIAPARHALATRQVAAHQQIFSPQLADIV